MDDQQQSSFNGWARVEVMGHQTHIGYTRTEAYGQAVMFRIDTPELPEREFVLEEPQYVGSSWTPKGATVKREARAGVSVLVGAGSIYRILPCTEEAALRAIDQTSRPELKVIALPEMAALPAPTPGQEIEPDGKDYCGDCGKVLPDDGECRNCDGPF